MIGFAVASHHDRIGMVGFEQGLAQRGHGPFHRPGLTQRWQQFRDDHPGVQGNQSGSQGGYSPSTPGAHG